MSRSPASLAIAIPTYNRSEILIENLLAMRDEINRLGVAVYISDDSNNEDTAREILSLVPTFNKISYWHNAVSLGHDKNCLHVLSVPKEDYIWYLGDSLKIVDNGLEKLFKVISSFNNPDFIVTNHIGRNMTLSSKLYKDSEEFVYDLAWHITLSGATVYRRDKLLPALLQGRETKNFPQVALILTGLSKACKLYFDATIYTKSHPAKTSYWGKEVFEVFAHDWANLMMSFSEIFSMSVIKQSIRKHSEKTGVLGWRSIVAYRQANIYDLAVYSHYKDSLSLSASCPKAICFLIAITPRLLSRWITIVIKSV